MTNKQAQAKASKIWDMVDNKYPYETRGLAIKHVDGTYSVGYAYTMNNDNFHDVWMGHGHNWESAFKRAEIKAEHVKREEQAILNSPGLMAQLKIAQRLHLGNPGFLRRIANMKSTIIT